MEGAMAASRGWPGGSSCLEFARNKELMLCRRGDGRRSSLPVCSHLQDSGIACSEDKNTPQARKLKPPGHGLLSDKKMITLLEALSEDLSVPPNSAARSNGAPPADVAYLADQARDRILADALEVVMARLAQGKAERKQRKRQIKALKKALKARKDRSSSADSADEVADVSPLCGSSQQEKPAAERHPEVDCRPIPAVLTEKPPVEEGLHLEFGRTADRLGVSKVAGGDKIEVCMGPKCKKTGSDQLLAAFERCGVEAVSCKCLGKCRSAPNVRVRKLDSHGSQLHLGVGIGEVDFIVAHHFGCGAVVPAGFD